ncbi:uncharacterized protein ACWYII_019327 [Salvelinus alpinus]
MRKTKSMNWRLRTTAKRSMRANQLQKNRKHMQQKFSVNEDRRAEAKDELSQMATLHANAKVNLEELEQKTFMVEQRMRDKRTTIEAELLQEQTNTENARWELHKEFEEALSATKQLEIETEKLRNIYNDKSEFKGATQ